MVEVCHRPYNLRNVREIPSTRSIANFLADPNYVQQIFVTSEPFFANQAGAKVRTMLISSSGYDPYRVQFTTRDFAARNPDVVAKFVRASIRGWQEYLRDPGPTNALLLKLNPALNPAQEAYTAQALRDGGFITGDAGKNEQVGKMSARALAGNLRPAQIPWHRAGFVRSGNGLLAPIHPIGPALRQNSVTHRLRIRARAIHAG